MLQKNDMLSGVKGSLHCSDQKTNHLKQKLMHFCSSDLQVCMSLGLQNCFEGRRKNR